MGRELLPPAVDHGGEAALVEVSVVPAVSLALVPEEPLQLNPLQRVDHGVPQVGVAVL